ncbi:MAG: sugar phosphate nucleotidyltransferase [Chloroflexi bacterium]|nr:sugar phosphate nucleotidyltransferase [Chloroflexota bacterium]
MSTLADTPAIILAGGKGTRLAPYTAVLPKPLMPIGDMPILEIVIRQLSRAGIHNITLSVGYLASLLQAYFADGKRWGVDIRYSLEAEPLGTAGPLALVPGLTDAFMVMNGDLLTTLDYTAMVRFHKDSGAVATVGLFKKQVAIDLGVIETNGDSRITAYVEKPTLSYEVSVGVYVMQPLVLSYVPPGVRFDLPDLIKRLVEDGQPVIGYRFDGYWLDIGRQEDYSLAVELFQKEREAFLPGEA